MIRTDSALKLAIARLATNRFASANLFTISLPIQTLSWTLAYYLLTTKLAGCVKLLAIVARVEPKASYGGHSVRCNMFQ
jgi:hypothetical protein